jgi:Ca2+/Na+ antiporter
MQSTTDLGSLIINIVVVVCAIQFTSPRSVRNRLEYIKGLGLALLGLFTLIFLLAIGRSGAWHPLMITSTTALSYCLIAALCVFSVQRTNDLRWSRWLNLVIVLPFVSLGWCMVLCVARKNPGSGSPAFEQRSRTSTNARH